jgi:hypothetical protein
MNPYLQDILHNITTRLAKLEEAQVKKEWVGLTDKEVVILAYQSQENECTAIRLAEQALKEKNHGNG